MGLFDIYVCFKMKIKFSVSNIAPIIYIYIDYKIEFIGTYVITDYT